MKASLWLSLLGLGMAGIYLFNFTLPFDLIRYYATPLLDLGKITGYQPAWAVRFTLGAVALFALYFAAWFVAQQAMEGRGKITIFGFAILFQALLLPTYPVGAADVFDYVLHGRVLVVYGANPLTTPAASFPNDPFLPYMVWRAIPTTYGPLWAGAGAPGGLISEIGGLLYALFYYKFLASVFILGSGVVILLLSKRLGLSNPWAGVLLFLWNPLIVFEFAGNAHNDALLIFFLLISLLLLAVQKFEFSFLALAAATLNKFVTAPLFVPLSATILLGNISRQERLKIAATGLVLSLAFGLFAYLPFWQGVETLGFLYQTNLFTTSLPALAARSLAEIWGWGTATQFVRLVSLTTLGLGIVLISRRWARGAVAGLLLAVYETLFLILVLGLTWVKPWYIAWLLAVAPLTGDTSREIRALLFTLTGFLSYAVLGYIWPLFPVHLSDLQVEAMLTGTVVFPVLIYTTIAHWPRRKEARRVELAAALPGDQL